MSGDIGKVLDRVRKMLSLAEHTDNEAEAALAAGRAAKLMEEHQLSEALVRLDDPQAKPEPILRDARLEPDAPMANRKRVAWKEAISGAVAKDLGVREFYWHQSYWTGNSHRTVADVRGFGRETAIQTWRYTCEYLWRTIDELADQAWRNEGDDEPAIGTVRAWKNAFRAGCAQRVATRIYINRKAEHEAAKAHRDAVLATLDEAALRESTQNMPEPGYDATARELMALALIERDQAEVNAEYAVKRATFSRGAVANIGSTSSADGYTAGWRAGDRVQIGGKRAALGAGQGILKGDK